MNGSVLALVLFLQPVAGQGGFATARPAECSAIAGFGWERAKQPNLGRYCALLASGTSKLVGPGSTALVQEVPKIADEADALMPGRSSPVVLKGRALLKLGRPDQALKALEEAKRRDDRALDDPVALLAWARANASIGRIAEAAQAYRAVLPRTSGLGAQERTAAAFEAGLTVMAQGRAGIEDAVAMLRQSRRDAQDAMQLATVAALALALDRSGQREEAKAVLADRSRGNARAILSDPRVADALYSAGLRHEGEALIAMVQEGDGEPAAKNSWRAYLEGPGGKGPWADHAEEHARTVGAAKKPTSVPHLPRGDRP